MREKEKIEKEWVVGPGKEYEDIFIWKDKVELEGKGKSDKIERTRDLYTDVSSLTSYVSAGGWGSQTIVYISPEKPVLCRLIKEGEKRKFICQEETLWVEKL